MENVKNVETSAKEVKVTKGVVNKDEKVQAKLSELLSEEALLIHDEDFKNVTAYKKLSDYTDEDFAKLGKGILKAEIKKSKDGTGSYVALHLKIADNVVLHDSLNQEKSIILKELRPELIGSETEIPVKMVSMLPLKNKKINEHTGETTIQRAYCLVAPICEGVVFNGGYNTNKFTQQKTSRSYLKNDSVILLKIHNAKNPDNQVKFYDLGEVGEEVSAD